MALNARIKKPSTRAGFRPPLPSVGPLAARAKAAFRRDGRLDENPVNAQLRQLAFEQTRLTNIVSSYQIERIPVTRDEAARAIEQGEATSAPQRDVAAFAHVYAILHQKRLPPLTVEWIQWLHKTLFDAKTLERGGPGEFKTTENGVYDEDKNEFVFEATSPEDTVEELQRLIEWFDGEAQSHPPAIGAAVFFAEFEAIHPFGDGNGRLGRLLNLYALKQLGQQNAFLLPLDRHFLLRHRAYYQTLETTNTGKDYGIWINFYLECLEAAQEEAERLSHLTETVGDALRPSDRAMFEWLLASAPTGWFQRSDYPNPTRLSGAALTNSLRTLVKMGFLESRGERRGTYYRLKPEALKPFLDTQGR